MSKTKSLLTVAIVAVMLAAGAGSAAFAQPQQPGAGPAAFDQPRIVDGTAVPSGGYPFMAALLDTKQGRNALTQLFCGGSLIDSNSVLTAAHCVYEATPPFDLRAVEDLRVVVGRTQLTSTGGQQRGVSNASFSSLYDPSNPKTFKYDYAVLKLTSPVTGITPARLPLSTDNRPEEPGYQNLTLAGWGRTSTGGAPSNDLRKVQVPIVSDGYAQQLYGSAFYPSRMIAAGGGGRGGCKGDSGGPLFVARLRYPYDKLIYNYWQFGIFTGFSATKGCGGKSPDVFTEVNNEFTRANILRMASR
jgi:secreted trypsin-like serine protease